MSNYTLINKFNLPEPGDIIATEKNLLDPYDDNFEMDFEINLLFEVLSYNGVDVASMCPLYTTNNLKLDSDVLPKHKLIDSIFNEWYIIVNKSAENRRKFKIDYIIYD